MGALDILIITAAGAAAGAVGGALTWKKKEKEKQKKILATLSKNTDKAEFVPKFQPFHATAETENEIYLIKIVDIPENYELIITNPLFWCINDKPSTWKRSTKPRLVPGVEGFVKYESVAEKKCVKIAIIYPNCRNISHYLNESDVELVSYKKPAESVYFVRYNELDAFFESRKKK